MYSFTKYLLASSVALTAACVADIDDVTADEPRFDSSALDSAFSSLTKNADVPAEALNLEAHPVQIGRPAKIAYPNRLFGAPFYAAGWFVLAQPDRHDIEP